MQKRCDQPNEGPAGRIHFFSSSLDFATLRCLLHCSTKIELPRVLLVIYIPKYNSIICLHSRSVFVFETLLVYAVLRSEFDLRTTVTFRNRLFSRLYDSKQKGDRPDNELVEPCRRQKI